MIGERNGGDEGLIILIVNTSRKGEPELPASAPGRSGFTTTELGEGVKERVSSEAGPV